MAICNLFKSFDKDTGNFMTFSQYTEDLTKSATTPGFYRVVPSKFIVLNVNYNKTLLTDYGADLNKSLPLFIQNNFENGCALLRANLSLNEKNQTIQSATGEDDILNGVQHWSTNLFWNSMAAEGPAGEPAIFNIPNIDKTSVIVAPEKPVGDIKYIGDINIQSYDEYDGMGYSEIYCYIPNDAKAIYSRKQLHTENEVFVPGVKTYVEGYDANSPVPDNWQLKTENTKGVKPGYICNRKYLFSWDSNEEFAEELEDTSFDFNTIVVLYDVLVKDYNDNIVKYKTNIPMGMYVTGKINPDGTVNNTYTKHVLNSEIYDSGTSYGLRIATRFTVTPESDTIKTVEVSASDDNYSAFCQVMSSFADTLSKMNDILDKIHKTKIYQNELYSIFKDGRTNVPYIKNVAGKNYWFVNGRNLGSESQIAGTECISYDNYEILDMINAFEEARIQSLSIKYVIDGKEYVSAIILKEQGTTATGSLNWRIYKDNEPGFRPDLLNMHVSVDKQEIIHQLNPSATSYNYNNVTKNTDYMIELTYKGIPVNAVATLKFVYPSFIGMVRTLEPAKVNYSSADINALISGEGAIAPYEKKLLDSKVLQTYLNSGAPANPDSQALIQYLYPAELQPLSQIDDITQNIRYDIGTDFHMQTLNLDLVMPNTGKTVNVKYYLYTLATPAAINSQFKFS